MESYVETGDQLEALFEFLVREPELFVSILPEDKSKPDQGSVTYYDEGRIDSVTLTLNQVGDFIYNELNCDPDYHILQLFFKERGADPRGLFSRYYAHPDVLLRVHLPAVREYSQRNSLASYIFGTAYFVSKMKKAVAEVQVRSKEGDYFTGSAFAYQSPDADPPWQCFLTCRHNIVETSSELYSEIRLILDGDDLEIVKVMPFDDVDVCQLITRYSGEVFRLGRSEFYQGQTAYSLGYPRVKLTQKSNLVIHNGIICGEYGNGTAEHIMVHSCTTGPGSSGGTIVDEGGSVLGIVHQDGTVEFVDGRYRFGHAIPMTAVAEYWNDWQETGD